MSVGNYANDGLRRALQRSRGLWRSAGAWDVRGGLRCGAAARAISLAHAARPLCARDRHCRRFRVLRREADRLASDRGRPASRAHRCVSPSTCFVVQGARRRRVRGARPCPAQGARGEPARADADACVRADNGDLDLAGRRDRIHAGAPRRLGCRHCQRDLPQQDGGRSQCDGDRRDHVPRPRLRGSRFRTDARPRAADRHRRLFHHPDSRTSSFECSPKSCGRGS